MLLSRLGKRFILFRCRNIITKRTYVEFKNPIQRTIDAITGDIKGKFLNRNTNSLHPEHADIVIIGGGYLGSSGAYWLKTRASEGLNVVVLEKKLDKYISTNWSTGILSQHYSLPENILLSQFSANFFRNINIKINKNIDIKFHPHGYIVLASDKYAENLEKNVSILKEYGIKNELLSVEQLRKNYPWINTSDVKLGCISTENEGVFDSCALLQGLVQKSQELGAIYIHGEVVGFDIENQRDVLMEGVKPMSLEKLKKIIYRTEDGEEHSIKFAICVLAAGTESANIAKLASIGSKEGLLSLPLPTATKESNVYSIECDTTNSRPGLNTPTVMDTSGLWCRRNGLQKNLLCGQMLLKSDKLLKPNENYELIFKPSLENRFPHFAKSEINHWDTEVYDYNTFDDTGIIGAHPYHTNMILATGFGKMGIQHAPGIGKAISDLVIDSAYTGVDLTRMGFDRLLTNEPLVDCNIY